MKRSEGPHQRMSLKAELRGTRFPTVVDTKTCVVRLRRGVQRSGEVKSREGGAAYKAKTHGLYCPLISIRSGFAQLTGGPWTPPPLT